MRVSLRKLRCLPLTLFFSKWSDEGISEVEYQHAKIVWKNFKMKNLQDQHDLYLNTDVLLLAMFLNRFGWLL